MNYPTYGETTDIQGLGTASLSFFANEIPYYLVWGLVNVIEPLEGSW